ncbi:cold shock and DUF1294 domain-containing protein [Shewanella sp. D64]|uniref:cold shock and DUF1294 domain-containing protein n=1 Tax=unclassified Shewanella TaxID=196818 RepID=UPI0022BA2168|nr:MULTISPECIES: cold shock and DUF1294 domain-containing protein [unclassified Shewanella]MEC4727345.1 cold shock and DUF1294 domain-containing protein [Shewanella sp. D64]MEC4739500.1 cold shock and DUF1294 domain-containing protein [Shewanella sp. E94]WBJ96827.1 cold shock and DUF1294 domain-containing protein [Shewanella sp. MTB7]
MTFKGKLVQWNDTKGFGFIRPIGQQTQVFVHIKSFTNQQRRPQINQTLTFTLTKDKQGRESANQVSIFGDKAPKGNSKRANSGKLRGFLILCLVVILSGVVYQQLLPKVLPLVYLLMSGITVIAYAMDKSAARQGKWRTKESSLHILSLMGGWPGALIAQGWLRHKSQKVSFRIALWCTIALNSMVLIWLISASGQARVSKFMG